MVDFEKVIILSLDEMRQGASVFVTQGRKEVNRVYIVGTYVAPHYI